MKRSEFFSPEHPDGEPGPVANMGKYVCCRDVYVSVNRLKDLDFTHSDVKAVIPTCLRGTALMWSSIELTEKEKDLLRRSNKDWYETLIKRFKTRATVARAQLFHQIYALRDVNTISPRAHI